MCAESNACGTKGFCRFSTLESDTLVERSSQILHVGIKRNVLVLGGCSTRGVGNKMPFRIGYDTGLFLIGFYIGLEFFVVMRGSIRFMIVSVVKQGRIRCLGGSAFVITCGNILIVGGRSTNWVSCYGGVDACSKIKCDASFMFTFIFITR